MTPIGSPRLRRDVGEVLRKRRLAAGMTQDRLAAQARITQAMVSRVERGLYPASLDLIERLFGALALELRVEARAAHTDLDRAIAELAEMSIAERLNEGRGMDAMGVLWTMRRWGPVPFVVEGALAAAMQGAPIPIDDADVAVIRKDHDAFERWLGWTAAKPWSEERQEFTFDRPDLRRCHSVRWQIAHGVVRTRFVDAPPTSIEITHDGETYAVRPLAEVEMVDPHAADLMARWRELVAAGSPHSASRIDTGEAVGPVAAAADELDEA
jgi:transcriptional regulator with XRE-family HTH domain